MFNGKSEIEIQVITKSTPLMGLLLNPGRGQLSRKNEYFLSLFAPENLASRDGFRRLIPRQPPHSD